MSLEDEEIGALRATAHPLRLQMLSLLTGAELSAADVARELDITQANASYHLRLLERAGLLTITGENVIRGGKAKLYRHVWDAPRPSRADAAGPPPREDGYVCAMAAVLPERYAQSEDGPAALTDAELWVEDEVWKQVQSLVSQASTLVHASAKPPRTEGTRRVNLTVAAFPMKAGGTK